MSEINVKIKVEKHRQFEDTEVEIEYNTIRDPSTDIIEMLKVIL